MSNLSTANKISAAQGVGIDQGRIGSVMSNMREAKMNASPQSIQSQLVSKLNQVKAQKN